MPILNVDSFAQVSSGWDVTAAVQNLAANNMTYWTKEVAAIMTYSMGKGINYRSNSEWHSTKVSTI